MDTYVETERYRAMVAALSELQPYAFTGKVEQHQIIEALGEVGGVWPKSVEKEKALDQVMVFGYI